MAEGEGNDNFSLQKDEIEALSSIYGADFHRESSFDREHSCSIEINECNKSALLQVSMSPDYPSSTPPKYTVSAPWLKGDRRENAGSSIIFQYVEKIREFMSQDAARENERCEDELPVELLAISNGTDDISPEVTSGDPIIDRKSIFQPHLAVVSSEDDVKLVLSKLKENKKVAAATHNIYAYRIIPSNSRNVLQDCEDDGETHAGSRLLHLLQILNATNVLIIVSRWYGGIHLGPDRFKHINNAARQILEQCGFIAKQESSIKKGNNPR